jgi:large conductance mechanosensitive channel
MIKFLKEFFEFIKEYKVVGMAVGIIMGLAATALVRSLVDNIIMPIITPFIPGGAWREAVLHLGPIFLKWGAFVGELLNFLIIAFAVFLIAKWIIREEKVAKK